MEDGCVQTYNKLTFFKRISTSTTLHFHSYHVAMEYFTFVVTWIPCFILFAKSSSHERGVLAIESSFNKGLERYSCTF